MRAKKKITLLIPILAALLIGPAGGQADTTQSEKDKGRALLHQAIMEAYSGKARVHVGGYMAVPARAERKYSYFYLPESEVGPGQAGPNGFKVTHERKGYVVAYDAYYGTYDLYWLGGIKSGENIDDYMARTCGPGFKDVDCLYDGLFEGPGVWEFGVVPGPQMYVYEDLP